MKTSNMIIAMDIIINSIEFLFLFILYFDVENLIQRLLRLKDNACTIIPESNSNIPIVKTG